MLTRNDFEEKVEKAGAIRVLRNTQAGGHKKAGADVLAKGNIYKVPKDITLDDATELVMIGKAEIPEKEKKEEKKS